MIDDPILHWVAIDSSDMLCMAARNDTAPSFCTAKEVANTPCLHSKSDYEQVCTSAEHLLDQYSTALALQASWTKSWFMFALP